MTYAVQLSDGMKKNGIAIANALNQRRRKMKISIKLKTSGWLDEETRQRLITSMNIRPAEVEWEFEHDFEDDNDFVICERIWTDMNRYEGEVWDSMQPLPAPRPHTALSVGDEVRIDGRAYVCADIGFKKLDL